MKKISLQENRGDCGYACLKNLLIHYHKNNDFSNLYDGYKENISFQELKEIGEKYNLELQGVDFEEKELLFNNSYSICQIEIAKKSHFIVFCYEKKGKVTIIDPNYGKTIVTKEWFLNVFTGKALIYVDHQIISYKNKYKLMNILYPVLYVSSLIIDYGLVYLLSFLMKNDNYVALSLITIFGLLVSVIGKTLIIKASYIYLDKKVKNLLEKNNELTNEELNSLLLLKEVIVKRYYNSINSFAIILFSIILLVENEVLNLALIIIIGAIIVLTNLFKNKIRINQEYMMQIDEMNLYTHSNETISIFDSINKRINSLIVTKSIFIVSLYLLAISFCFLVNYFNQYYSLTYILFTSGLFILFIDRFNLIFSTYQKNGNDFTKIKSMFVRIDK